MIDRDERLPVTNQCELLDVARSTVYYQPKPTPAGDVTPEIRRSDHQSPNSSDRYVRSPVVPRTRKGACSVGEVS